MGTRTSWERLFYSILDTLYLPLEMLYENANAGLFFSSLTVMHGRCILTSIAGRYILLRHAMLYSLDAFLILSLTGTQGNDFFGQHWATDAIMQVFSYNEHMSLLVTQGWFQ
jgi:hypothetical protein